MTEGAERAVPALAGRPSLMGDRTSLTLYPGMIAMMENATLDIKNRSHTITAQVGIPQGGAEGVILAQGGRFAGWSLSMKEDKLKYCYNWFNKERYRMDSPKPCSGRQGHAAIRVRLRRRRSW